MSLDSKRRVPFIASCLVLVLMSLLAIPAIATKPATIKTSNNVALNRTLDVDSQGRTVYVLRPETRKKLLCTSSDCLKAWPMVTVKSAKTKLVAGAGVKGKLAVLKRGKMFQVTLGGKPLYRFAGDQAPGDAKGDGIASFGGTWHFAGSKSNTPAPPSAYGY